MESLAFGTMNILKHGEHEASRLIDFALSEGFTHFDTADVYERTAVETFLGQQFKGKRQHLFLASKGGNEWKDGRMEWNPSPRYLRQALEASLSRLQTDHLDLYYIHGGTMEDDLDACITFMQQVKQEGLIRHIGLSSLRPNVINYWMKHASPDYLMTPYSLLDRRLETLELPEDVRVVARGTLAKGILTDNGHTRLDRPFEQWSAEELQEIWPLLPTPRSAYALRFVTSQGYIALPGASTQQQLAETLEAFQHPIDFSRLDNLKKRVPIHQYQHHLV